MEGRGCIGGGRCRVPRDQCGPAQVAVGLGQTLQRRLSQHGDGVLVGDRGRPHLHVGLDEMAPWRERGLDREEAIKRRLARLADRLRSCGVQPVLGEAQGDIRRSGRMVFGVGRGAQVLVEFVQADLAAQSVVGPQQREQRGRRGQRMGRVGYEAIELGHQRRALRGLGRGAGEIASEVDAVGRSARGANRDSEREKGG